MKKTYKTKKGERVAIPQHGYIRRLVRQIVYSLTKRQNDHGLERKTDAMVDILKDMRESIELMAREMARHAKRNSRNDSR